MMNMTRKGAQRAQTALERLGILQCDALTVNLPTDEILFNCKQSY